MAEVEIVRKQIIVVGEVKGVSSGQYPKFIFTDKEGNEYKVGANRKDYFVDVIKPGTAVELGYSTFKGTEYIYSATLVKDQLEQTLKPTPQVPQSKSSPSKEAVNSKPLPEHKSSPETGMWWNQLGEMLRVGDIDKTTPQGKAMRTAYYAEMIRVLGINVKEVQPANKLIEAAMKLGAVEIPVEEGE